MEIRKRGFTCLGCGLLVVGVVRPVFLIWLYCSLTAGRCWVTDITFVERNPCAVPCFYGIIPGQTLVADVDEAVDLVNRLPHVTADLDEAFTEDDWTRISWSDKDGKSISSGELLLADGTVLAMRFSGVFRPLNIFWYYGLPDRYLTYYPGPDGLAVILAFWDDKGLMIEAMNHTFKDGFAIMTMVFNSIYAMQPADLDRFMAKVPVDIQESLLCQQHADKTLEGTLAAAGHPPLNARGHSCSSGRSSASPRPPGRRK
ncbi:MAG: hypothetical protein GXY52_10975 [Chloroflexi bacterium]|nr:hypothetical protein [Chloroflexota bacterium]